MTSNTTEEENATAEWMRTLWFLTIITRHLLVRHNSEKIVHLIGPLLRLHDALWRRVGRVNVDHVQQVYTWGDGWRQWGATPEHRLGNQREFAPRFWSGLRRGQAVIVTCVTGAAEVIEQQSSLYLPWLSLSNSHITMFSQLVSWPSGSLRRSQHKAILRRLHHISALFWLPLTALTTRWHQSASSYSSLGY